MQEIHKVYIILLLLLLLFTSEPYMLSIFSKWEVKFISSGSIQPNISPIIFLTSSFICRSILCVGTATVSSDLKFSFEIPASSVV